MAKMYVVHGTTGEYSDRSEWNVAVVTTKRAAERLVTALDRRYQTIPQDWRDNRRDHEEDMKSLMSLDPNFGMDYTGTRYFIGEVDFFDLSDLEARLATTDPNR